MSSSLLRTVLRLDALITGVNGLAYLLLPSLLSGLFGLPLGVQSEAGLFLTVYAGLVFWCSLPDKLSRPAVWACIIMNLAWSLGSVLLLLAGDLPLTSLGSLWVLLQALVVLGFATAQWLFSRARS